MRNRPFTEQLLKGRVAEYIFSSMLAESRNFTVIPFGYEYVFPTLLQHRQQKELKRVIEFIRKAPDFAVINQLERKVYLVEVKYRRHFEPRDTLRIAQDMLKDWNPSSLFLCTLSGFFFSACEDIIANNGVMHPLLLQWVRKSVQDEYSELLNRYLADKR